MPIHPKYFQLPTSPAPIPKPKPSTPKPLRKPLLRLEIRDLSTEGAKAFLTSLDCATVLQEAVDTVIRLLYTDASRIPPTRSVTLILRSMGGVAYTTGMDMDGDHKEIHFSTDYISNIPKERRRDEMLGVITHEMVHCWQWDALGTCPGGLVEGIADYVRLRAGYVPPHWKKEATGSWDGGYQHTGYFLDWLETKMGEGTVVRVNDRLRGREYKEEEFWNHCCGSEVKELWERYAKSLSKDGEEGKYCGESEGKVETASPEVRGAEQKSKTTDASEENGEPESKSDYSVKGGGAVDGGRTYADIAKR